VDNGLYRQENPAFDTAAVHAGELVTPANPASSPPLYQASSYEFADLDEVEAIYTGERPGAIYGRYGGPNAHHFESAIAELEGAGSAAAAASGMAAINAALRSLIGPGETLVASAVLYGGTQALLDNDFQLDGHPVVFVDIADLERTASALAQTRAPVLYVEALSNPLMGVADIPQLARIAHAAGARLIVDATFATPALLQPLALGADLVLHSVGKYLGGHGDVGAGVVAGPAELIDPIRAFLVRNGATIPHFEAWLALRGVRTLGLRMTRHSANAAAVAAYLDGAPGVGLVHHPSRPSHPQHRLAAGLYPRGTGGIVSFDLAAGRPAVDALFRSLRRIAVVHSLGEVATTISYSRVASHRSVAPDAAERQGVGAGTVRLSCGIEDAADIVAELAASLAAVDERLSCV
jgi:cystathionine beta-lyase/cystathionine gamma-synthase